jgi:hypothetical protein
MQANPRRARAFKKSCNDEQKEYFIKISYFHNVETFRNEGVLGTIVQFSKLCHSCFEEKTAS